MAHREFRDRHGREWAAWTVQPEHAERRGRNEFRVPLAGKYSNGWLCFETKGEKRRLAPYPAHWPQMTDEELEALSERATKVEHAPRRLVE